jgi:hypothetical protein
MSIERASTADQVSFLLDATIEFKAKAPNSL